MGNLKLWKLHQIPLKLYSCLSFSGYSRTENINAFHEGQAQIHVWSCINFQRIKDIFVLNGEKHMQSHTISSNYLMAFIRFQFVFFSLLWTMCSVWNCDKKEPCFVALCIFLTVHVHLAIDWIISHQNTSRPCTMWRPRVVSFARDYGRVRLVRKLRRSTRK